MNRYVDASGASRGEWNWPEMGLEEQALWRLCRNLGPYRESHLSVCICLYRRKSWSLKDFKQKRTDFAFSEAYLGRPEEWIGWRRARVEAETWLEWKSQVGDEA